MTLQEIHMHQFNVPDDIYYVLWVCKAFIYFKGIK